MSDSITVEITVPATRFPQFARALAELLEEPERSVFAGIDCADPSRFTRSIEPLRGTCGDGTALCLTLAFAGDPVLRAFRDAHPDIRSTRPDTVPVGCVWTTFAFGIETVVASFTSATRSIADVLRDSTSARGALRELADRAGATSAVAIDEWGDSSAL